MVSTPVVMAGEDTPSFIIFIINITATPTTTNTKKKYSIKKGTTNTDLLKYFVEFVTLTEKKYIYVLTCTYIFYNGKIHTFVSISVIWTSL
jgi:hypothetical protein